MQLNYIEPDLNIVIMDALIKDTGITYTHAKSVREYSCMEEPNNMFRPYMEDSISVFTCRVRLCGSVRRFH